MAYMGKSKGAIIFYREGWAVCLWGGQNFMGLSKEGPVFSVGQRGEGDQNFLWVTEGGGNFFSQDGDLNFSSLNCCISILQYVGVTRHLIS